MLADKLLGRNTKNLTENISTPLDACRSVTLFFELINSDNCFSTGAKAQRNPEGLIPWTKFCKVSHHLQHRSELSFTFFGH